MSFAIAWKFLTATRLGRGIGIGLMVALLAGGIYLKGRSAGVQSGTTSEAKNELEDSRAQMAADRAKLADALLVSTGLIQQKDALIAQKDAAIADRDKRIAQKDALRAQEREQITRMTDPEVFADLTLRLGLRSPQDATPQLYPAEIKEADRRVAERDRLLDRAAEVDNKIADMQGKIAEMQEKQRLTEHRVEIALNYVDRSDQRFVNAYNVFYRVHKRSIWTKIFTMGIVRDKKITELKPIVPPERPAELQVRP